MREEEKETQGKKGSSGGDGHEKEEERRDPKGMMVHSQKVMGNWEWEGKTDG